MIQPVEPPDPSALDESIRDLVALTGARTADGNPLAIVEVLAHRPELVGPFLAWSAALAGAPALGARRHEIAALRASWHQASDYEWGNHVRYGLDAGLTETEIDALGRPDGAGAFADPHDGLVVRAADEMFAGGGAARDEVVTELGPDALVDLVWTVGHYAGLSLVADALALPIGPDLQPVPPGRVAPTPLLVGDVVRNAAAGAPDHLAIALGDDHRTFAELLAAGESLAAGLADAGTVAGDVVLVQGIVSIDMAELFVGCALIGAVFAPIDPRLPADTLAAVTALASPSLVVEAGNLDHLRSDGPVPRPSLDENDPHVVFFTSGTSGLPKGAVISHRVSVLRSHPGSQLEPRGALVCPYPLFHMAGWTMAMQQWHARDALVVLDKAEAPAIVDAVRRHSAARLNAIPGVWQRILDHLRETGAEPLTTLRFADTGTYATPPELLAAIAEAAPNAHVRVFYGSTEVGNVTALDHGDITSRVGSCGRPSPLVEIRLGDGDEMLVRTPVAFSGYLGDPDATAAAFDRGWYRTGDMAAIDDDGFVSIVGRVGQLIRTGGESVSPTQVEQAFADAPGIADLAVIGVPDAQWGEVVTLCLVLDRAALDGDAQPSLDALVADVELPAHARPRRLEVVDAIPRTAATGQIDRRRLLSMVVDRPT